ncbi:MAG: hypothetical protein LBT30_05740, partial [Clostridiales bacterium]|nr:hypothetical protein [Clostridiales bacterium]
MKTNGNNNVRLSGTWLAAVTMSVFLLLISVFTLTPIVRGIDSVMPTDGNVLAAITPTHDYDYVLTKSGSDYVFTRQGSAGIDTYSDTSLPDAFVTLNGQNSGKVTRVQINSSITHSTVISGTTGSILLTAGTYIFSGTGTLAATGSSNRFNDIFIIMSVATSLYVNVNITFNTGGCVIFNDTGTVTVNGGTMQGVRAIKNGTYGTITVNDGTINATDVAIYNSGTMGTIIINGGTVSLSSGYYAIMSDNVSGGSTITVNGGTVTSSGTTNAIYGFAGTINVTGGNVTATGSGAAIYSTGNVEVNISGGTVTGTTGLAIDTSGIITVSGGIVTSASTSTDGTIWLRGTGTLSISGGEVRNTADSASSRVIYNQHYSGKIEISLDAKVYSGTAVGSYNSGNVIYNNDGSLTVNGGTITAADGTAIYNNKGSLTVNGGTVTAADGTAIYNNGIGQITLSGGSVTSANTSAASGTIYLAAGMASKTMLSVSDGVVNNTANSANSSVIYNAGAGDIVISGTAQIYTIVASNNYGKGIYNSSAGNVEINGGTVSTIEYAIYNAGNGNITVNDGIVSAGNDTIYNALGGTITVNGGTVSAHGGSGISTPTGSYAIHNASSGEINITDGTISSGNYAIFNLSSGEINISGGYIESDETPIFDQSGIITMTDGTIESADTNSLTGTIYINGGTAGSTILSISGGTVKNIGIDDDFSYVCIVINNKGAGNIEISGSAKLQSDAGRGIYLSTGNLIMNGGEISAYKYAIYSPTTGNVTLNGGTISASAANKVAVWSGANAPTTLGDAKIVGYVSLTVNGAGVLLFDVGSITYSANRITTFEIRAGLVDGLELSDIGGPYVASFASADTAYIIIAKNGAAIFTVAPPVITIHHAVVTAKNKVYDGKTDVELTVLFYSATTENAGTLISIATSDYTLGGAFVDKNVANGKNVTGTLVFGSGYVFTGNTDTYNFTVTANITAVALTVTVDDQTSEYNGNEPTVDQNAWSVTSGSIVGSDNIGLVLTKVAGVNVGRY